MQHIFTIPVPYTSYMSERYRTLHDAAAVNDATKRMAQEIISDYPRKKPLFVALLRGAAPFASKLLFEIARQQPEMHPELDYMMVSTYGRERHAGEPRIVTDLSPSTEVSGRTVIVLDDILDKGITANFVQQHLRSMGAGSIRLAVLASKQTKRVFDIEADYTGFTVRDEWLVGMGMDDAGLCHEGNRWIDEIWEIVRE